MSLIKTFELDGRKIHYVPGTQFVVQVGRGSKGKYDTRTISNNPTQAVFYYNAINIGNGYKKRLLFRTATKTEVLARATS